MIIIGIDLGFSATGIVALDTDTDQIIMGQTVRTKPEKGKRHYVADDDLRRCRELARGIVGAVNDCYLKGSPFILAVEVPHGGAQGARSNRCMGMVTGVLGALVETNLWPVEYYQPQECKKAATGRMSASKIEVEQRVRKRWPGHTWPKTKAVREHQIDAAAAIMCALDNSNLVRFGFHQRRE